MFAALILVGAGSGVAAPAPTRRTLVVRVTGGSTSLTTGECFFRIRSQIVGGGTLIYCLKTFTGRPGPSATLRDGGVMTVALSKGSVIARVRIVQRFARDGLHARQTLTGTVTFGSGAFRRARGTIAGGGSVVEDPPGQIAFSDLRYVIFLR